MAFNWLDKIEYPFSSNYFEINNVRMHYIDEGEGETLLFVHGTPSWSFDFRNIIKDLKDKYRCIAIDHIGFGLSDKPEKYDYSTKNHSNNLEKFITEKALENITLIVHDFGGPIGLNYAIKYPEKIKNLVILNYWLWSSETDPEYVKLKKLLKSPLLPLLYKYLNFSPKFILPQSFGEHKLTRRILKQYTQPFSTPKERYGALAFAYSLLNDQKWFEELWEKKSFISEKPCLFIWGMKDPVLKPYNLEKFQKGFKNSISVKLEKSGHFPQEEEPLEVSKAIEFFLTQKLLKEETRI